MLTCPGSSANQRAGGEFLETIVQVIRAPFPLSVAIQMTSEARSWPYEFPASEDFPKARQRGSVVGRLLVRDRWGVDDAPLIHRILWFRIDYNWSIQFPSLRYIREEDMPASSAYVGLALPGEVGSWQTESKVSRCSQSSTIRANMFRNT